MEEKLPAANSSIKIKRTKKQTNCEHPGLMRELCIKCGQRVTNTIEALPFPFIEKTLRLRNGEVTHLRNIDFVDMMRQKKLHLILDLDNTLLHSTTQLHSLNLHDEFIKHYICPTDDFSKGIVYFTHADNNNSWKSMTKLRPYVRTFLHEASKYYSLSISTYGNRSYALEMAKILDPNGCYFGTRVVSRDDLTIKMRSQKRKRIDAVLGYKNLILILDDRRDVWRSHTKNLIWIDGYHFFYDENLSAEPLSLLSRGYDELEEQGALANVLKILKIVHRRFFDPKRTDKFSDRDVRMELTIAKAEANVPSLNSRIIGLGQPFNLIT